MTAAAQINGTPTVVIGWNAADPANSADGHPALYTHLGNILNAIVGPDGLVLFAESSRIRRIAADGTVQTVLSDSRLTNFTRLAEDTRGDIYYTTETEIYKWPPGGLAVKIAGSGGSLAKEGLAANDSIIFPQGLAVDPNGNLVFSDYQTDHVFRVDSNGILHVVAGTGSQGTSGEGGPATSAQLVYPLGLAYDADGDLLLNDSGRILKIQPDGTLVRYSPPGVSINAFMTAFDAAGNVYFAGAGDFKVSRMSAAGGTVTVIAGNGTLGFSNGCGSGSNPTVGDAKTANFSNITGVALDAAGDVIVADGNRIRKITPSGQISTIAGAPPSFGGDGGPASVALLDSPHGLAYDSAGILYIADTGNNRIRKVGLDSIIQTIAGQNGPTGDMINCSGSSPQFLNAPESVAADSAGNLYIADTGNNRLLKLAPDGTLSPFASTLTLNQPHAVGVDAAGAIWVGDNNQRTLKLASDGTVADTLPALRARSFNLDLQGNFYLTAAYVSYRVTAGDQLITVAGLGLDGSIPASGPPPVLLPDYENVPVGSGVTRDGQGTVYNLGQQTVDLISGACHVYSLGASTGFNPVRGPWHLAVSSKGDVYASDFVANVVWKLPHLTSPAGELPTPALSPDVPVYNAASMVVTSMDLPFPIGSGQSIMIRNLLPDAIVPGELIRVYGQCIGPFQPVQAAYDGTRHVPATLGGVQLSIGGVAAPLVSVQEGMVVAQTPFGMPAAQNASMVLTFNGVPVTTSLATAAYRPGLFDYLEEDGSATALAVNQDGTVNSQSQPAPAGSTVAFFGTGLGQTNPPSADGLAASDISLQYLSSVQVTIGGAPARVTYAGVAPGFIGMSQINVAVPTVPHGANAVQVLIGGAPFRQVVQVWVK